MRGHRYPNRLSDSQNSLLDYFEHLIFTDFVDRSEGAKRRRAARLVDLANGCRRDAGRAGQLEASTSAEEMRAELLAIQADIAEIDSDAAEILDAAKPPLCR